MNWPGAVKNKDGMRTPRQVAIFLARVFLMPALARSKYV